ncbi:MAG TPA: hypothetical protein VM328_13565, partial [Fimbriimonadaceae bacterium]|nr:hypothetical protein [Fimbriimonadaceae bacterium]
TCARDMDSEVYMARHWEVTPPAEIDRELADMSDRDLESLFVEGLMWVNEGDYEDIAIARAITERGHSEDFSYWFVRELRVRQATQTQTSTS